MFFFTSNVSLINPLKKLIRTESNLILNNILIKKTTTTKPKA